VNPRLTAGRLGQLWPLLFQKRLLLFFLLDQKEPKTCLPKVESRPVALDDPLRPPVAAQNKHDTTSITQLSLKRMSFKNEVHAMAQTVFFASATGDQVGPRLRAQRPRHLLRS
jgi:hypothetical protein